jgi:transposase
MQYIALDGHKRYSFARIEDESGEVLRQERIWHQPGAIEQFLACCEAGSPVAVESIGNWYWIVDEVERAGMEARLVNARVAKLMMGQVNKTDKLDAAGLNRLQRSGTLPAVWIPPAQVRDERELLRARMVLVHQRTQLKNRVHSTLDKYGLSVTGVSDIFGRRGRGLLEAEISKLPPYTADVTRLLLGQLDDLGETISALERRIAEVFESSAERNLLLSLPGVGPLLSAVIHTEVGSMERFGGAPQFASYAGTTPRVHASGGRSYGGPVRRDASTYLRWAYVEAANVVVLQQQRHPDRHVTRLYQKVKARRGHHKAILAVARHLAEATYWMLSKGESYREPRSSRRG